MGLLDPRYTIREQDQLDQMRSSLNVAQAILRERLALGLTQEELGKTAGTKQSRVSEIEAMKGNPRFDTLDRIAYALGLMIVLQAREPVTTTDEFSVVGYSKDWATLSVNMDMTSSKTEVWLGESPHSTTPRG